MSFTFRIEVDHGITLVCTDTHKINVMTLFALKGACKLEALGMKHSSGRSACQTARMFLSLPKNTRKVDVAKHIAEVVDDVKTALEHENQKRLSYN